MSDDERLYTEREAAAILNLASHRTLSAWRLRRTGPPFCKIGHCIRYRRRDLLRFIENSVVEPAPVKPT